MKSFLLSARFIITFTLVLFCFYGFASNPTNTQTEGQTMLSTKDDDGIVLQFLREFETAYNSHDPVTAAKLYATDATWLAAAGAVFEGQTAITDALEYFMTTVPPVLSLHNTEAIVLGDHAVTIGTYTLSGDVSEQTRTLGGSYLNVLKKETNRWQIVVQQMNYNVAMQADMWVGSLDVVQGLPEGRLLSDLARAYEAYFIQADTANLSTIFNKAGWLSFAGSPLLVGHDASSQVFQDGINNAHCLTIHEVSSLELGNGIVVDSGWYELVEDTAQLQWGTYTVLAQQDEAGEVLIDWLVSTSSPLKPSPLLPRDPVCLDPSLP